MDDNQPEAAQTVGDRLEALRLALGGEARMNFATSFGLDQGEYTKIVAGTRNLSIKRADALRKISGVTLDFIYYGNLEGVPVPLRRRLRDQLRIQSRFNVRPRSGDET